MITLYTKPVSSYGHKVRMALTLKGLNWEMTSAPADPAERRRISPFGKWPALVDADGTRVVEADVILEYLDERYPEPPLHMATPAERARVRILGRLHDLYLEPAVRVLFGQIAPAGRDPAAVAASLAEIERRLGELEATAVAAPWLAGDRLTIADCTFPATLTIIELLVPFLGGHHAFGPKTDGWWRRLQTTEPCAGLVADYRRALDDWFAEKQAA